MPLLAVWKNRKKMTDPFREDGFTKTEDRRMDGRSPGRDCKGCDMGRSDDRDRAMVQQGTLEMEIMRCVRTQIAQRYICGHL